MFSVFLNREIKFPSLGAQFTFDLWFYVVINLGKGPLAIKKQTALRPLSGQIYCNNHVVIGHGQGSYIWKYIMGIMIIGLLYKR